jgi:hypothetical protein
LSKVVENHEAPRVFPSRWWRVLRRRGTLLRALRGARPRRESHPAWHSNGKGEQFSQRELVAAAVFLTKEHGHDRARRARRGSAGWRKRDAGDIFALAAAARHCAPLWLSAHAFCDDRGICQGERRVALGAAIVEIEELAPKTAFKFRPKPKPKVIEIPRSPSPFDFVELDRYGCPIDDDYDYDYDFY